VTLTFTFTTTLGVTLTVSTASFEVKNTCKIGVLLPRLGHGSAVDLPVRAIRQMVELLALGHTGPYNGVTISFWLQSKAVKFSVVYIYTSDSLASTLADLKRARKVDGIRLVVGPYDNEHADAIADWIASEMPKSFAVSPNAQLAALDNDVARFHNSYRLRSSTATVVRSTIQSLVNRMWTTIALVQDKTSEPLPELFYQEARLAGITILR
jgi:hypothetical protein